MLTEACVVAISSCASEQRSLANIVCASCPQCSSLMKQKINFLFITLLTVVNSPSLLACATCYGQSDSKLAEGMNWGILTLMVVVYGVLMGIAGFFAYIIYRSKRLARSEETESSKLSS